jgi:tetratricopeptide (TPR) repeat protein
MDENEDLVRALAGRYDIAREVGRGGMSIVYLARDVKHGRSVAVKVLRPELTASLGPERFLREIAITASLVHPNILALYDSGEASGFLYYVMPYVDGPTLGQRVQREVQLPLDDVLAIARQVAAALDYAHAHGVIHRDIKPDNILFLGDHVLVADFGLARAISSAASTPLTEHRFVVGTAAYMSPEQCTPGRAVDARSDIYSFGCVVFEMIAGVPPFRGATPDATMSHHLTSDPPSLRTERRNCPATLDAVVRRALAKIPADRFRTAGEFVRALESPGPIPVPPSETPGPSLARRLAFGGTGKRRRWLGFAALGAAAIAAALAMSAIGRGRKSAASPGRIIVAPLENRTGLRELDDVGLMAGDRITDGLLKTGIVEVMPTAALLEATRYGAARSASSVGDAAAARVPMRALALDVGASTVVGGSFTRRGDSLYFRVSIADKQGSRVVATLADIAAPIAQPMLGIEELRNRVMGWLAILYDERIQPTVPSGDRPPTYAAYRAFNEGMAHYVAVRNADAVPLFWRAYQLDTSFTEALLYASLSLTNIQQYARADSLLRIVAARRGTLSDYYQAWLDYRLAFVHGDREAALAAIGTAARMAPESKAGYNHAVEAYQTGHVHEAFRAVEALSPTRGAMRDFAPYWTIYGDILHSLGDFAREREIGNVARLTYPDRLWQAAPEVRALAARGQLADLAAVFRATESLSRDPIGLDYGHLLNEAAEELRAHGYGGVAREYFEKQGRWLSANSSAPDAPLRRVQVLYALERWNDATALLAPLRRLHPTNVDYLGMAGVLDVRTQQRAASRLASDSLRLLRKPYDFGAASYYRARIASALGERDSAVARLRESFAQGRAYHLWLHRGMDFEPLRGFAPFDAMVRGRD